MRQQKTSKKNRSTYIYYDAYGNKVMELSPGESGITEALINLLHQEDDAEFNAQRRENYHAPIHYQAYQDNDGEEAEDRNEYLADDSFNPEKAFLDWLTRAERNAAFKEIWDKLLPQQRDIIKKKAKGLSNVEIAAEEGVSEAAIRNRLAKIQARFKNLR